MGNRNRHHHLSVGGPLAERESATLALRFCEISQEARTALASARSRAPCFTYALRAQGRVAGKALAGTSALRNDESGMGRSSSRCDGRVSNFLFYFFAAHGLQGDPTFFAAHGLQGFEAFLAAQGLQAPFFGPQG